MKCNLLRKIVSLSLTYLSQWGEDEENEEEDEGDASLDVEEVEGGREDYVWQMHIWKTTIIQVPKKEVDKQIASVQMLSQLNNFK